MRVFHFTFLFIFLSLCLQAQDGCKDLTKYLQKMRIADSCINLGDYRCAYVNYNTAEIVCGNVDSVRKVIKSERDRLFTVIDSLRKRAIKDRIDAEIAKQKEQEARKKAEEAEAIAKEALKQSNKLIDAFFYYKKTFALAVDDGKFYYVNINGNRINSLGEWDRAGQFNKYGYARVRKGEKNKLINTYGDELNIANDIDELGNNTKALIQQGNKRTLSFNKIVDYNRLVFVKLDRSSINKIPDDIFKLTNLEFLSLQNCKLKGLPMTIGELSKLKNLTLKSNKIEHLTPGIGGLKDLRTLDLSYNQLESLPVQIGELVFLEELYLNGNKLDTLPNTLTKLKQLKILGLRNTELMEFPNKLLDMNSLETLDLSFNFFSIPDEISQLKNLKELYLGEYSKASLDRIQSLLPNCEVYHHSMDEFYFE